MAKQSSILKNLKIPPSLKEAAYLTIKEAILAKRIEPGNVYNEASLAKELGISKTPVREALITLASKGFLTFLPRKGFLITVLSEKDIRDLFDFRMALEAAVMSTITATITKVSIEEIESIFRRSIAKANANDSIGFLKLGKEFHSYLASLTQNQYIISALENSRDLIDLACAPTLSKKERFEEVLREHDAIIVKLKNNDARGAVLAIEEHIRITKEKVLLEMEQREDSSIQADTRIETLSLLKSV